MPLIVLLHVLDNATTPLCMRQLHLVNYGFALGEKHKSKQMKIKSIGIK